MASSDILKISESAQEKLIRYMNSCFMVRDEGFQLRNRLEEVDRAYMRESDFSAEQQKAELANRMGDKTKLQNLQVPMVMEDTEASVGFLTNMFLTEYPMFKFVSDPQKIDLALAWNSLVGEDQIYFKWAGQFNIAFRNGAKYNFAPIEVDWCKSKLYKPVNAASGTGVQLEKVIWEGNRIRAIDPYNTIYDPRVPIHEVHTRGEFVGYVDQMSRIELKLFLASLDDRLKNDVRAFESGDWNINYYVPQINRKVMVKNTNWLQGNFDWASWVTDTAKTHIDYKNMYTVATIYAKIMPFEFDIRAPKDQTPDIWKLIGVNGVLVYAQPMVNAHNILPIIIAQPKVDNLAHQTKSQAENQIPFQEMTSALWNARLAGARRRISDRMLYNPLLVDPDHINSPNPAAKIPIRPTAYGRKLEEAVHLLPYEDRESGMFIQDAQGIAQWGMRVSGRNNTTLGQYQKGNKLNDEFHETMANAGQQDRTQSLMWEAFAFTDIKMVLRSNYLQFTPAGERYNREEEKVIKINPSELRKAAAEFQVSDGLLPSQKLARTDVIAGAMQWLQGDPSIRAEYEVGDLFSYLMKVQGVDKLDSFKKAPNQMNYERALNAWSASFQEIAKKVGDSLGDGKYLTIEDVKKLVGPMPDPKQFGITPKPQTPNQQAGAGAEYASQT